MVDGKMVNTGACRKGLPSDKKPYPITKDNVEIESFAGECVQKEGDIYISRPRNGGSQHPFKPKTFEERLMIKDELGNVSIDNILRRK